jgi:hypothetical protein
MHKQEPITRASSSECPLFPNSCQNVAVQRNDAMCQSRLMHRSEQYRYSITSLARVTICGGTVRPLNRRSFSNVIASPDKFIADARKYFLAHDGEAFIRHCRFGAAKERRTRRFDHVVDSLLV